MLPLNDIRFSAPTKHYTSTLSISLLPYPFPHFFASPLSSHILFPLFAICFRAPFLPPYTITSRFNVPKTSENLEGTRRSQKSWLRYFAKVETAGRKLAWPLFEETNYGRTV